MKKSVLKTTTLIIGILLAISSCEENNGRSLGDIHISLATVVQESENTYSFVLDNGKRLWSAAKNTQYTPTDKQRVFLNYTILWDNVDSNYDYGIKVNEVWNILTKPVIELNEQNQDSIGNDPIIVKDIWVGADYLNISFLFNYNGEKPHLINLVKNNLPTTSSPNAIDLEFRHNAYESAQTRLTEGFVCFDLRPLRADNANSVDLSIKIKERDRDITYDVVYEYDQPTVETMTRIPTPVISVNEYY